MKKSITAMMMLSLCATLCAQTAPKLPSTKMYQLMDPVALSNSLARTGGLIQPKAEGPKVLFLNTQTRVADTSIDVTAEQIQKTLRLSVTKKDAPSDAPVTSALTALKDKNTSAVLVITDVAGYPSLLIAPEDRWAVVNVAALAGTDVSAESLADRTQKEVWRAFGYLMGAAHSNFEHCLMKPVLSPSDLDQLKSKRFCPEPFNKIVAYAQKLGMKPFRMTSYRKAVEEGWAPAPTNAIQQAIWNELKK